MVVILHIELIVEHRCRAVTSFFITTSVIVTVISSIHIVMMIVMAVTVFKLVDSDKSVIICITVIEELTLNLFTLVSQMIVRSKFLLIQCLIISEQEIVENFSSFNFTFVRINPTTAVLTEPVVCYLFNCVCVDTLTVFKRVQIRSGRKIVCTVEVTHLLCCCAGTQILVPLLMSCALVWSSLMMDIRVVVLMRIVICAGFAVMSPSVIEYVLIFSFCYAQVVIIFGLVEWIKYGFM